MCGLKLQSILYVPITFSFSKNMKYEKKNFIKKSATLKPAAVLKVACIKPSLFITMAVCFIGVLTCYGKEFIQLFS